MSYGKYLALTASAAALLSCATLAPAQVSINIGVAPVCPYGYFDYAPYDCAPYGYYGPDWFTGGVFIGAGPWFHGPHGFYGHVDNRYDPHHGYHGPLPPRGAEAIPPLPRERGDDHQGHVGNAPHNGGGEHALPDITAAAEPLTAVVARLTVERLTAAVVAARVITRAPFNGCKSDVSSSGNLGRSGRSP